MKNLNEQLHQWRTMEEQSVWLATVKTDDVLQPRNPRLTRFKDAARADTASKEHEARMRAVLFADVHQQLEPILLANINGKLFVVDGHHRLRAYRGAGRKEIPARIMAMDRQRAIVLSKMVNIDGVKLPLTRGQYSEAAWQFLAAITQRGRLTLEQVGLSCRTAAAAFGDLCRTTISNMMRKMKLTDQRLLKGDFPPEWCDPGTGWPRWKVASGGFKSEDWLKGTSDDQREQMKIERCAAKLATLKEDFGEVVFLKALELAAKDAEEETAEVTAESCQGQEALV